MPYDPAFADAIASIESGGRYDLLGPETKSGDRAYGKFQVMGNNVGPWTKEILGQEMTPHEFLASPDAQEAVFQGKFSQAIDKYGTPQDAASVWFTGRPLAQGADRKDILGTSGASYVAKFDKFLAGRQPAQQSAPPPMMAAAPGAQPSPLPAFSWSPGAMQPQAVQPAPQATAGHQIDPSLLAFPEIQLPGGPPKRPPPDLKALYAMLQNRPGTLPAFSFSRNR